MHVLSLTGYGLVFLWLGLLSLPAQALSLGNLTVSSNASPSFTASLPFSDDKPVRLPELQTRLATDAEYAQWGMQMATAVRELRLRVVPASQTVGYVELYSPTALSQDSFDLLVWASYAGQTMLTHYKVVVQDVPSLIKGKTLSISQPSSNTPRQIKGLNTKTDSEKPPKTPPSAEESPPLVLNAPASQKHAEVPLPNRTSCQCAPRDCRGQPTTFPPWRGCTHQQHFQFKRCDGVVFTDAVPLRLLVGPPSTQPHHASRGTAACA
jgi:hypothetical protein